MFRKMSCLVSFVLVLGLVGDGQAAEVKWTDAGPDRLWSTPANWNSGAVPTSADLVPIDIYPGPIIANEGAVADKIRVATGGGSEGILTVDGGTLTVTDWIEMGYNNGSNGTLNMNSGTLTIGSRLIVGRKASATLNMTGGTITVANQFRLGNYDTSTGHANLYGGIITAWDFEMGRSGSVGTMDVGGGTLIINGNKVSRIQGYIDNGWITAYDGNGTLRLDYDVTNEGKTTLNAVHSLNPYPADGGLASPGDTELSWTLPDPCVPNQTVLVDVYFTDDYDALWNFNNPEAIKAVNKQNVSSMAVQTQPKTRYYWAVDTYIGDPNDPILGPIFSFLADNQAPQVAAGTDGVTWLVNGVMTKNLDATVTDDGAYTVQWTVISEPNDPNSLGAVITDPSAEDTSITLSALGEYVLQLEAFDGEYTGSGTVTINVYNDGCEAAKSLPDYEPFPGDINGDCKVDDLDLAILEEDWLKDNSLTEP